MSQGTTGETVTVRRRKFALGDETFLATEIMTGKPVTLIAVHDDCTVFSVVALNADGEVIGWSNPPESGHRRDAAERIKKAFAPWGVKATGGQRDRRSSAARGRSRRTTVRREADRGKVGLSRRGGDEHEG